ncbi:MAG: adenylyltransferase/cytidyltransferase family protein [bacterium]
MNTLARITSLDTLQAWRREVAGDKPVAVVRGIFDFFHPGNLYAIRKARELSLPLMVLVDPDEVAVQRGQSGYPQNHLETRMEMVSHLRGVSAVASLARNEVEEGLTSLAPFVWTTVQDHSQEDSAGGMLKAKASWVEELLPLAGCFSGDIIRAMDANRTPLALPPGWDAASGSGKAKPFKPGVKRVTVNGCFDVLHVGHLRFLAEARSMGDFLTVLINNDASVARYKGATRPVFPERFRAAALQALGSVDEVLAFPGDNPLDEIRQLRPVIHVKGGSYEPERVRQERELVESWGGQLVCTPMVDGFSTTNFIQKVRKR